MKLRNLVFTLLLLVLTAGVSSAATYTYFSDEASFDDWFSASAKKMNVYEIMTGYEDGSFGPEKSVSRAELAVIVDRLLSRFFGVNLEDEHYECDDSEHITALYLYVRDVNGNPIEGITLPEELDMYESEPGEYQVDYAGYSPFTLTVSKEGYNDYKETISPIIDYTCGGIAAQYKTILLTPASN